MNVFSFVQWNKYFHSVKDEMYHSTRLRLVEWNILSFTSWKYLYHCTHKHSLFVYYCEHIQFQILCVPERMGIGKSAAISKNVSTIFTIFFWFNITTTLDNLQENLVNQSNSYEDVAFEVDTKKTWYTQVHKGTSWVSKQKCKSVAPSKSSEFWFLFVSTFKVTSSKLFNWFKRFSYTNCQGKRHVE